MCTINVGGDGKGTREATHKEKYRFPFTHSSIQKCFYLSLQFMTFIFSSLTLAVCLLFLFSFSPRNINLGNLQPRIVSSLSAAASSSSSALVVFQSSSLGFWQKCHRCTELPKPFHANYYAPNYLFFASPFRAQITISWLCC